MAKTPEKKSIIMARSRRSITLPPGIMGFENMFTPDTKFGEPTLKVQVAFNEDQVVAFANLLESQCIEPLWEQFEQEAKENGKASGRTFKRPVAMEYLEDKLKAPHEKAKTQLPTFDFSVKQQFKNRDGDIVDRTITVWDSKGNVLDGPALKIGRGSVIRVVALPALFMNALIPPQPSLQFQGIQLLKLESFSGGSARPDSVDDEALSTLDEDFEVDDLSQYAASNSSKPAAIKKPSGKAPSDFDQDLGDDVPF